MLEFRFLFSCYLLFIILLLYYFSCVFHRTATDCCLICQKSMGNRKIFPDTVMEFFINICVHINSKNWTESDENMFQKKIFLPVYASPL